jgi:hypothetical protein
VTTPDLAKLIDRADGRQPMDTSTLTAHLLKPNRSGDAALPHSMDPLHAWLALRTSGALSLLAADEPGRRFVAFHGDVARRPGHASWDSSSLDRRLLATSPMTTADALAIAGSAPALVEAERLARELARRLAPWGQPEVARFCWRLFPAGRRYRQQDLRADDVCRPLWLASAAVPSAVPWEIVHAGSLALSRLTNRSAAQRVFERDLSNHESWATASERGALVPEVGRVHVLGRFYYSAGGDLPPDELLAWRRVRPEERLTSWDTTARWEPVVPAALVGRPFGELANPFEPLLQLWGTGCALVALRGEDAHLVMPGGGEPSGQ